MAKIDLRNVLGKSLATKPGSSPLESALSGDEVFYRYKPTATDIKKHGPAYAAQAAMLKAQAKLGKKQYQWGLDAETARQNALDVGGEKPPKPKAPPKVTHIDETPVTSAIKKAKASAPTTHFTAQEGHEKTQKLRDFLNLNTELTDKLQEDVKAGKIQPIPGVTKKPKKGIWGKATNLAGSAVSHVVHGTTGDVVGKTIELLGRPQNAIASEVVDSTGLPTKDNPTAGFNQRTDWKGLHKALDNAAKSQGWSAAKKQEELNKYKKKYNVYEPGDKNYVDPQINALGLSNRSLNSAKRGLQGKEHHSIGEITVPAAQNIALLKVKPGDNPITKILKQVPGVAAGFTGDVVTDPLSYGGGISTPTAGIKDVSEASKVATAAEHADVAPRLAQHSAAYAELLHREQLADEAATAYKANKTAAGLKHVQQVNKDLREFRDGAVGAIRTDAAGAGLTHEELNSLGVGKSVEARMADYKNPPAGSITQDAHSAAKEIMTHLDEVGAKATPVERDALIAKKAVEFMSENAVKEEALANTLDKVKSIRDSGQLVSSARKAELYEESLAEAVHPRTLEMKSILDEASKKRFQIKGAENLEKIPGMEKTMRALYIPFEKTNAAFKGSEFGQNFGKAFSMGSHFPGATEDIRRAAESHGILENAEFNKEIHGLFNGVSNSDKEKITHALQGGYDLSSNPKLESLRQAAQKYSDDAFQKLVSIGKYKMSDKGKNYVFHHYRSGKGEAIKAFKADRKTALRAGKTPPTLEAAQAAGFAPEKRIDQILLHQHLDMSRAMQRANFRQGIMSHFGVLTDNPEYARQMGLEEVKGNYLNKPFQDYAASKGAKYHLPKELQGTFKEMDKMLSAAHAGEGRQLLHFYDKLIRGFKTSTTIGNPGNWVNNTAGDVFLNWVDGVRNPLWYQKSASILGLDEGAAKTVRLGGKDYNALDVLQKFKEEAPSGGFIRTEGGKLGESKFVPGVVPRAGRAVQNAYETREEWGRFAHFMSAMDEELAKGAKFDNAASLSARRIAKWNIDYTAITPFERNLRKNFIPFYTFMRKAVPLMLETIATRPGKVLHYGMAERALSELMGQPPVGKDTDQTTWPSWAKEAGGVRLGGGAEPTQLRDVSPLQSINRLVGGDKPADVVGNVLNQLSPGIKIPFEVGTQQTLFNQQPIKNWNQYFLSQIPPVSQAARIAGSPLKISATDTPPKAAAIRIMNYLGIPVTTVTENQQQSELHRRIALQPQVMKKANEVFAPAGLKLAKHTSSKNGTYYTLTDTSGDKPKVIDRYRDPARAIESATQYLEGKAPR